MDTVGRPKHKPLVKLLALIAFACLGFLALYWLQRSNSNYHTLAVILVSYLLFWGSIFFWSNASRTEKASWFLLTTTSVGITIGFFELLVAAKFVDFRVTFNTLKKEPWHHPDNILDPKLLHIHKPYYVQIWDGVEYRYDGHGLRNESDLETADIIVIGDSFVEGWGVSADRLLTSHLARQLSRPVANLGQSWYGPQQELELLRRFGLRLRPDTCVWIFFEGNDLVDLKRYKLATRDWEAFSKNLHSFVERSFSKNAILRVQRFNPWIHNRSQEEIDFMDNRSGIFRTAYAGDTRIYFPDPQFKFDEEAIEQFRANLIQAYDLCHNIGARFLVAFAPIKLRVYKDFTEFDGNAVPRDWMFNDLPERIEAIVRTEMSAGQFLDLTVALKAQAKNGSLVYFPGWDTHWSPEGHRVVATAISDVITQWKLAGNSGRRP